MCDYYNNIDETINRALGIISGMFSKAKQVLIKKIKLQCY